MVCVGLLSGVAQNDATEQNEAWPGDPRELVPSRRKEVNGRRKMKLHAVPDCISCEPVNLWPVNGQGLVEAGTASLHMRRLMGPTESDSVHVCSDPQWHWCRDSSS